MADEVDAEGMADRGPLRPASREVEGLFKCNPRRWDFERGVWPRCVGEGEQDWQWQRVGEYGARTAAGGIWPTKPDQGAREAAAPGMKGTEGAENAVDLDADGQRGYTSARHQRRGDGGRDSEITRGGVGGENGKMRGREDGRMGDRDDGQMGRRMGGTPRVGGSLRYEKWPPVQGKARLR